jgi:putative ABC transport system permease protein
MHDARGSAGSQRYWFLLGRLRPGVSIQQAEADLTVIAQRLSKIYPQNYPRSFTVQVGKLVDSIVLVRRFKTTLYTVLAAVGLLLLIASATWRT